MKTEKILMLSVGMAIKIVCDQNRKVMDGCGNTRLYNVHCTYTDQSRVQRLINDKMNRLSVLLQRVMNDYARAFSYQLLSFPFSDCKFSD